MEKFDLKFFKELGVEEVDELDMTDNMKPVWRSRWWWYNWFSRNIRRHTNFWSNESNTYGAKNHSASYNVKVSNAVLKVFGKYNCAVDRGAGANQRIGKINRYNKYGINKRLSVFNTKQ